MMYKTLLIIFTFTFSINLTYSQATVGVTKNVTGSLDGYTFFSPFSGTKAYIIDNCGNLINQWDRGTRPGLSAYFLENGLMMRTFKPNPIGPFTSASNAGGIELVDWDNNLVWKYDVNTAEQISHHDAVMMPNGNILMLTWQLTYRAELIELGRDPNEIASTNFMWSEKIIEVEPEGNSDGNIVWEWHINDHYIQDFDSTKQNFGVISEHPELFDINLPELDSPNSNASRDWNHFNAIDYNESLDQILISVRNSDEIWIIDHSTTIEQAASHEGGNSGMGGDILYRWGNPESYKRGTVNDQKLFGQHGVNWIKNDLENSGDILIFNNGNGRPGQDFSQIDLITTPINEHGNYDLESNNSFGPLTANTIYGLHADEKYYSPYLSNAQRLSNGNTLINSGSPGRIFEIDSDGEIVWEYIIPLFGDAPATQGQNVSSNGNFRAYKFNMDYPGFINKDLTPGLPIELNPIECDSVLSIADGDLSSFEVFYDQSSKILDILNPNSQIFDVLITNISGQLIEHQIFENTQNRINLNCYTSGLYIVSIISNNQWTSKKIFIH